jgi:hypothetical protein
MKKFCMISCTQEPNWIGLGRKFSEFENVLAGSYKTRVRYCIDTGSLAGIGKLLVLTGQYFGQYF